MNVERFARRHPWGATAIAGAGLAVLAYGDRWMSRQNTIPVVLEPVTTGLTDVEQEVTGYVRTLRHHPNPLLSAYGQTFPDDYQPE